MEGGRPPLILTLTLDDASFALFDDLRRRHYPPERNQVPAHLTLFHTLPGEERRSITALLDQVCRRQKPIHLQVARPKFTGSGVAFPLASAPLEALRRDLAREWQPWLTAQDRQGFRPHVTVQNKVSPQVARAAHADIAPGFRPFEAAGTGLHLWEYRGGPWRSLRAWTFRG